MTTAGDAAIAGLTCPMPTGPDTSCAQDLHLVWDMSRGLYLSDVITPAPISAGDAWVQAWSVECEAGHVLLVPDDAYCQHDNADQAGHECDVDASDEVRSFRAADAGRLAGVLARMTIGDPARRIPVPDDAMHFWPATGGFLCGVPGGFRSANTADVTCLSCKRGLGHA